MLDLLNEWVMIVYVEQAYECVIFTLWPITVQFYQKPG